MPRPRNQPQAVQPCTVNMAASVCQHCGFHLMEGESKGMCCSGGKVNMNPLPAMPASLSNLFEDAMFRRRSRQYNSLFAMAAVGVSLGNGWDNHNDQYPNTLSLNGTLYHCIPSASTDNNALRYDLKHLRLLYSTSRAHNLALFIDRWLVYDTDTATTAAAAHFNLPRGNMESIKTTLYSVNPYAAMLRSMGEMANPERGSLILRFPPLGSTSEVAAIFDINGRSDRNDRNLTFLGRDSTTHQAIHSNHPAYFTFAYPLLFPHGSSMWYPGFRTQVDGGRASKKLTMEEYYSYFLLHESRFKYAGRLQHQFLLDLFTSIEENRLDFIAKTVNQRIADRIEISQAAEGDTTAHPGRVYLPDSFTNSPRQMRRLIDDGLATVSQMGKPTFFITITCNPLWPEFLQITTPTYNPADDPIAVCRIFHAKLKTNYGVHQEVSIDSVSCSIARRKF